MTTVTLTEFCERASEFVSKVEEGETIQITREGKPVVDVSPSRTAKPHVPSWKLPGPELVIPGVSLSKTILEDRGPY